MLQGLDGFDGERPKVDLSEVTHFRLLPLFYSSDKQVWHQWIQFRLPEGHDTAHLKLRRHGLTLHPVIQAPGDLTHVSTEGGLNDTMPGPWECRRQHSPKRS